MLSFWEQQSFTNYQYAVIGGGLVGLSTALALKDLDPSASVAILEQGIIPQGASTRNAGFACFGSLSELLTDLETMGAEAARELVSDRWSGLKLLRHRIGDASMQYENHGGYELLFEKDLASLQRMDEVNHLLEEVFGQKVFTVNNNLISRFGFNAEKIASVVVNPMEGQLNPGEMIKSLLSLAKHQGIDYLSGAYVNSFNTHSDGVSLVVSHGASSDISTDTEAPQLATNESIQIHARRLAVCTNAFSSRLLPDLDLNPGRGQVIITEEIPGLKFQGVFHYEQGYYYFRNVGTRVLIGGGRNLDFQNERTTEFGQNQKITHRLMMDLSQIILPGTNFNVASSWSGIMAFGDDKRPLVGLHSPQVGYAVRLGGMGVALGSMVGNRLARLICLK